MNARYFRCVLTAIAVLPFANNAHAADIGTAFTYQGFLEKPAGTPLTDTCTFEFKLCDDAAAACAPGTISHHPGVAVTDGVFTVADVDFGAGTFTGEARWMEVYVQCTGDGGLVALSPRVELTPAPYSIRAGEGVGGPNALNVTPSGDVGIGTTTPAARLDVNGAARTTTLEITGGSPQTLAGWGYNAYGQTDVPAGTFTAVAAGGMFSLAIRSDGTLAQWGADIGTPPSGTFVAVAAGPGGALAISSDGTLAQWSGIDTLPSGTFSAVAVGSGNRLAIRTDGTLVGWGGLNEFGENDVPSGTFIAVAAGWNYGLAIRSDGTLAGWGDNFWGQTDVPAGMFIAVAAGNRHSLAIRTDGTLAQWGGIGTPPAGTFTAVAAAGGSGSTGNAVAIRSDGTLIGWGDNVFGQTDVPAGTFTAVAVGDFHSLAIRSDQTTQFALLLASDSAAKPGSNTWTIWSDRRLKKNIEPLSGALERLLQLRGVTFQWIDPASQGGITGTQMGLIADEVSRAFPQWVGRDPKGYQTLTVGGFEALTAEALRELRAEKDRQLHEKDCEIAELREKMDRLEAAINALTAPSAGGGAWNVLKNDPWN